MKPIQVSFDSSKMIVLTILLMILVISPFFLFGFAIYFLIYFGMSLMTILFVFTFFYVIFFLYLIRVDIKNIFFKGVVLESNEKGIQINFFYKVFIPWEDVEGIKTIAIGVNKFFVVKIKNAAQYKAKTKEGALIHMMEKNMKEYLTPFVFVSSRFPMAAEILEDILNENLADYKALQAANNNNI